MKCLRDRVHLPVVVATDDAGASIAEAAFALLPAAMDPMHGSVTQMAAVVCHRLTATFVGLDATKRSSSGWDRRTAGLNLVNNFLRCTFRAQCL